MITDPMNIRSIPFKLLCAVAAGSTIFPFPFILSTNLHVSDRYMISNDYKEPPPIFVDDYNFPVDQVRTFFYVYYSYFNQSQDVSSVFQPFSWDKSDSK